MMSALPENLVSMIDGFEGFRHTVVILRHVQEDLVVPRGAVQLRNRAQFFRPESVASRELKFLVHPTPQIAQGIICRRCRRHKEKALRRCRGGVNGKWDANRTVNSIFTVLAAPVSPAKLLAAPPTRLAVVHPFRTADPCAAMELW